MIAAQTAEQITEPQTRNAQGELPEFHSPRLAREWRTVAAMVESYCRSEHKQKAGLCTSCRSLLDYATIRLQRCQFGEAKTTCAKCPVHCYAPARREEMKQVMRIAGPKMLWQHPVLAFLHWRDSLRKPAPARTQKST